MVFAFYDVAFFSFDFCFIVSYFIRYVKKR